ncbi:rRNA small subunit methyltransferase I [invertebrate metagenome]|uniref:rRNA small subunit methyltransferase I n=1 Tax=invertebrate metagenome TaxID=1711999 RepID=A0A484H7Z4_9ZZZZ
MGSGAAAINSQEHDGVSFRSSTTTGFSSCAWHVPMATLFIIATPIGNLQDISVRALAVLRTVQVLACEDTRITRKLLSHYRIPRPPQLLSVHEYNEHKNVHRVVRFLSEGHDVAYVSDAGMPGISDPGYLLVCNARAAGHIVVVVPGPSALIAALVTSGLPMAGFTFLGFLPRQSGRRQRLLARMASAPETLVLYESPRRLGSLLADALSVLGDRRAAVTLDLTKVFESVEQDWLSALSKRYRGSVRGEATVVIAGHLPKFLRAINNEELNTPLQKGAVAPNR